MTWINGAQYVADLAAVLLLLRMLRQNFKLGSVFGVFCFFVGFQLLDSISGLIEYAFSDTSRIDYRITWMATTAISWALSVWLVYALVNAILKSLPGILRFSKMLLNATFLAAIVIAFLTVKPEMSAAKGFQVSSPIADMVVSWLVLDRAISMALILVIVAVLIFILWFPVAMPRNLAVLSVGMVVFFGVKTAVLLLRTYWSSNNGNTGFASTVLGFVLAACFAYWFVFLTPSGAASEVRLGHVWSLGEQQRLIGQLESMNSALLRSARR